MTKLQRYILGDDKTPVPLHDIVSWALWMDRNLQECQVALTGIKGNKVSTVFLGRDHQLGEGSPLLFETMVLKDGDKVEGLHGYWSTWQEAQEGHNGIVAALSKYGSSSGLVLEKPQPKLYAVYLGGQLDGERLGEDHEVVFVVAPDKDKTKRLAKLKWKGISNGVHIDAVQELKIIDGYKILLEKSEKLNDTTIVDGYSC